MTKPRPTRRDRPELLRHLDGARTLARSLLREESEAEDVSQDAVAMALALGETRTQGAWLYGAVRNVVMRRGRQDARRERRERTAARNERGADHGEMLAAAESHRRLVDHVLSLDERDRDVLLWRYFHGEAPKEIAAREGRSVAAVSNQLSRAHRALKRRLDVDGGRDHWMSGLAPLAAYSGAGAKAAPFGLWAAGGALLYSGAVKVAIGCAAALACASLYWLLPLGTGGSPVPAPPSAPFAQDEERADRTAAVGNIEAVAAPSSSRSRVAALPSAAPVNVAPTAPQLTGRLQESRGLPIKGPRITLRGEDGTLYHASGPDSDAPHTWDALPVGEPLEALLEVDGKAWPEPVGLVEMKKRSTQKATWTIHTKTVVRGMAVNEHGKPLADQLVSLHRGWNAEASFPGEVEESDDMGTTLTGPNGLFVFPPVVPGNYQLMSPASAYWAVQNAQAPDGTVTSTELEGRITSKTKCSSWTKPVVIPFNQDTADLVLTLYTEGQIRGQVVSELTGKAVTGKAALQIDSLSSFGWTYGETNSEGYFVSPPLPPGPFKLQVAGAPKGWVTGSPVEASTGDHDVKFPVLPAATVSVRIDPGADTLSGRGRLTVKAIEPKTPVPIPLQWLEAGETSTAFTSLAPGPYSVQFLSGDGALAGLIPRVELGLGELPGGLVLQTRKTGTIEVTAGAEVLAVVAIVEGVKFDRHRVQPGRKISFRVPHGPVTLRITRGEAEAKSEQTLTLEAGATHSVE